MSTRSRTTPRLIAAAFISCLAVTGATLLLAAPATAGPGSPNLPGATDSVYPLPVAGEGFAGAPDEDVAGLASTGDPSDPPAASTNGGLPFTGMSAAAMLAIGLLALLAGFALRRFSHSFN